MAIGWKVEYGFGKTFLVTQYLTQVEINLFEGTSRCNLCIVPLHYFDIILGMDLLQNHKALTYFHERLTRKRDYSNQKASHPRMLLAMQLKRVIREGGIAYAI